VASLLSAETHQLQNISIHIYFIFGALVFYVLARSVYNYSRVAAFFMLLLYAVSPVLYYTIYNVFQAQIIAMGITLCIYLIVLLMIRNCESWKEAVTYLPLLVLFNWGIAYTYPHMLPLLYLPIVLYLTITLVVNGKRPGTKYAGMAIGISILLMFVLYPGKLSELVNIVLERKQSAFGWFLWVLTPETLAGFTLKKTNLAPHPFWTRTLLSFLMVGLLGWGMKTTYKKDRSVFVLSTTILGAVVTGYLILSYLGRGEEGWGGYKSYKLISFFLPFYLLVFGLFFKDLKFPLKNKRSIVAGICLVLLLGVNIYSAHRMIRKMTKQHRIVTKEMVELKKIGENPRVESINIMGKDWWNILWEAKFLMRKKLYFETSTYEGRLASELKGEWDLMKYQVGQVAVPASDEVIPINRTYYLIKHTGIREQSP
jgi:hypothetical protein